jgi:hypothetical protein
MKKDSNQNCSQGCGSEGSSEKIKGINTSNISIMPAMEPPKDPMAEYEKSGYELCSFVEDFVLTDVGPVPKVKTVFDTNVLISTFKVRCGIKRHNYLVTPGLYCVGNPDKNSEVLVTANFKLTFDHVRSQLQDLDAWILVLDTKGVNVCVLQAKEHLPQMNWSGK